MTTPLFSGPSLLLLAAAFSALAALLHIAVVLGGPAWYRFCGAGEKIVRLAARGSWYPPLITMAIALVLAIWSAYAVSAAGMLVALPFLKPVLSLITAIYLLRGIAGFVLAAYAPGDNSPAFWLWSSAICLIIGAVHAAGLYEQWPLL